MVATSGRFPEALLQNKKNKKKKQKKMNTGQNHGQPSQAEGKLLRGRLPGATSCPRPRARPALWIDLLWGWCCLYVYMKFSPRTDHRPMDSQKP